MPDTTTLEDLGYSERWRALSEPYTSEGLTPARVVRSDRGSALVSTAAGVVRAKPSARLRKMARDGGDLPTVGDWVVLRDDADLEIPLVEAVLPRTSAITRGDPGNAGLQVLAANMDVVFIVHPLDAPPNLRRIERELALAWESGAVPVVVLAKADLSADVDGALAAVAPVTLGVDVLVTSAVVAEGLQPLLDRIADHRTAVLIGPSGAGKSTLLNELLGQQRQETREVRVNDGRGRHTTVSRELVVMPGGGLLIDTPGLRSLALTGSDEGIASAFSEIDDLSSGCRFGDCTHSDEPGCAVQAAVAAGVLSADRLASYHKLIRESQVAAARTDARLRAEEERRAKTLSRTIKHFKKHDARGAG